MKPSVLVTADSVQHAETIAAAGPERVEMNALLTHAFAQVGIPSERVDRLAAFLLDAGLQVPGRVTNTISYTQLGDYGQPTHTYGIKDELILEGDWYIQNPNTEITTLRRAVSRDFFYNEVLGLAKGDPFVNQYQEFYKLHAYYPWPMAKLTVQQETDQKVMKIVESTNAVLGLPDIHPNIIRRFNVGGILGRGRV